MRVSAGRSRPKAAEGDYVSPWRPEPRKNLPSAGRGVLDWRVSSAVSFASSATSVGAASSWTQAVFGGSASFLTTSSPGSTTARAASRTSRSTRVLGYPSSRRWPVACPSSPRTSPHSGRWGRCTASLTRTTRGDRLRSAERLRTAEELGAAGQERARAFSWERAARATLEVYRDAAGGGTRHLIQMCLENATAATAATAAKPISVASRARGRSESSRLRAMNSGKFASR